jgi:hypothetical protein
VSWRPAIICTRATEDSAARPLVRCGWPPEKVEALIKDDAETLAMWREAVTPAKHVHADGDIVPIKTERGNGKAYTLSRLKREAPALFQRVVNRELSANAAAIEGGFRQKLSPLEQIERLLPRLSEAERLKLRELLR